MKHFTIFFIISLIFINVIYAREINGYFVSNSNDTVNVIFNIPTNLFTGNIKYERIQVKIKYYDSVNVKHILRPEMAKEFNFNYRSEHIRMLKCFNNLNIEESIYSNNVYVFLHLIKDGKLRLYNYFETHTSPATMGPNGMMTGGGSYTVKKDILQKNNGALFKPRWLYFKDDMSNYFSDCPSLKQKIESKTLRSDDILIIVDEYNRVCK